MLSYSNPYPEVPDYGHLESNYAAWLFDDSNSRLDHLWNSAVFSWYYAAFASHPAMVVAFVFAFALNAVAAMEAHDCWHLPHFDQRTFAVAVGLRSSSFAMAVSEKQLHFQFFQVKHFVHSTQNLDMRNRLPVILNHHARSTFDSMIDNDWNSLVAPRLWNIKIKKHALVNNT